MPIQQDFEVELIEKEIVNVVFAEKEIITVQLRVVDILDYYRREIISDLKQEVPTHISGMQFQTSVAYVSDSLKVFVNGIKEKINQIQKDSTTKFTFLDPIDVNLDYIEVEYVEITT